MLKKRRFGKTKLLVSEIGLGCWQLGGLTTINKTATTYGNVNEKTADKIIKQAIELGINVFDTADVYSLGNSERRLGKRLKHNRKNFHIFTKAGGVPTYSNENPFEIDLSYHHLISALDRSLKRLQTDYVDLFQIHTFPKNEEDFSNIEKAFETIKSENKARYCGVSIGREYDQGIELIERNLVDSLQIYFSLLDFGAIEKLLPLAKKNGIGIIAAEPLGQGFLTGKYKKNHNFSHTDIRNRYPKKLIGRLIDQSKKFEFLKTKFRSLNQIALAYVLNRDEISTCIPGVKNTKQLKSNISSKILLTQKEINQITKIQKTFKDN